MIIEGVSVFLTGIYREFRESVVRYGILLPMVWILEPLLTYTLELNTILFLWVYSFFLVLLFSVFRRLYRHFKTSIKEAESSRYPPEISGSLPIRKKISLAIESEEGEPQHKHIKNYSVSSIVPDLIYAIKGGLWALGTGAILGLFFAGLLSFGYYEALVHFIEQYKSPIIDLLGPLLSGATGVLFTLAEWVVPATKTGNQVIVITMIIFPGYFFVTTAENLLRAGEKLNRRILQWIFNPDSRIRQHEFIGTFVLTVFYSIWIIF